MPRINRGDPAYETAMREAKALFDEAMAKSAMKGRGRPAAAKPVSVPIVEEDAGVPGDVPDDIAAEIVAAGGDLGDTVVGDTVVADTLVADTPVSDTLVGDEPVEEPVDEPEPVSAPAEPAAAKRPARRPRGGKK